MVITPQLVAWLSGIKGKNLDDCGKFTLASDMSAIRDITSIDLSNVDEGVYELIALPLKIGGGDSSPVRAILRTLDGDGS